MQRIVICLCFLFLSASAFADQLLLIKKDQAQKAVEVLSKYSGKPMLFFCGCCDNDKGEVITLKTVEAREFKSPYLEDMGELYFYKVFITYTDSKGMPDSGSIDLAYAWLQVKGKALNVADACGFDYDPCVTNKHFAWTGKKKPVLPKQKKKK